MQWTDPNPYYEVILLVIWWTIHTVNKANSVQIYKKDNIFNLIRTFTAEQNGYTLDLCVIFTYNAHMFCLISWFNLRIVYVLYVTRKGWTTTRKKWDERGVQYQIQSAVRSAALSLAHSRLVTSFYCFIVQAFVVSIASKV